MKIARKMPDTKKLRSFYITNYLFKLLQGHKNAVLNHNTSLVIVTDGRSGLGKTTLSFQTAIFLDKTFNLDKVFYNPDDFLEGLAKAKKGDCIIFDEAMLISSRSALSSVNKMIVQSMSMIRSKQIFIIFCVNSIFDLDKNLAISRCDLLLHVYGENLIDRGKFLAFYKPRQQPDKIKQLYLHGKKDYRYSFPKGNFSGTFPKEFIVNENAYDRQKDKGVNDFLRGMDNSTNQKSNYSRDVLIFYLRDKHEMKTKELAKLTCLTPARINMILARMLKTTKTSDKYIIYN